MINYNRVGKLWIASAGGYTSMRYGTQEGATAGLVEHILRELEAAKRPVRKVTSGPCGVCEGWGAPTGCRECGIRCMGG